MSLWGTGISWIVSRGPVWFGSLLRQPAVRWGLAAIVVMAESGLAAAPKATLGDEIVESIEGTPAFPRNSEGAFGLLHSGRIVYYFSQFVGDSDDNSSARIAEIDSDDEGRSWSKPRW